MGGWSLLRLPILRPCFAPIKAGAAASPRSLEDSRALTGAARERGRRLPFQRQKGKGRHASLRSSASPAVLGTSAARATLAQFPRCRIYFDILDWLSALVPLIDKIGRHDPDLAKQLKRASRSVALNCAEGSYAKGGSRIAAYRVSLKEMRESCRARDRSQARLHRSTRAQARRPLPENPRHARAPGHPHAPLSAFVGGCR